MSHRHSLQIYIPWWLSGGWAGAPQIPSARGTKSACGRRASAVGMLFYEIVETAQAILISYILIDGSAQAVSHIVGFISTCIRNLR